MSPLHILILAAGKGTRMYSEKPKVLHEIGGRPMLQRVIDTAQSLNPDRTAVIIGHGRETVIATINTDADWVIQEKQLGTGHAVLTALPLLAASGKTLVLYGDVPLIDTDTLHRLLEAAGEGIGLLTDVLADPTGYGRIIRDPSGRVAAIIEEKDADAATRQIQEINTGILVLPNAPLADWLNRLSNDNAQGEYYLTDLIALANHDGVPVTPLRVGESHLAAGVNTPAQLATLERIFQNKQAETLMQNGLYLTDPARFDLRGSLHHGRDCRIDPGCIFEGNVILGDNCTIGAHCVLKNVKLDNNCTIAPFSHLEGCTVGTDSRIGPYARIRPDSELAAGVHIGNFVEIKNSRIGNTSKANHLSYIGDTEIGSASNIGAGSITANYDGVHKYRTVIGNRVRIGSNTVLVAPVSVGDAATTGAGSVITRDCPPERLTLSRSRQTTVDGWQRPEKAAKPEK